MAAAETLGADPERIRMLDPYRAVDLASRLIRADAMASGIPASVVDIPSAVAAPDGGVDGLASESPRQSIHGLVKKGATAYQFRTGPFAPGSSIADILFDKRGEVKPRIRSCVELGGTLVVLLFGWDGTARTSDGALAERFRAALAAKSSALAGAKVDVWGLNRIAAAVGQCPGLAADLGGGIPADTPAMSHVEWSRTADMAHAFKHGRAEDAAVGQIRAHLRGGGRSRGMPVHARVSGRPGSGKTRLVLEATRAGDLAPRVVYAANPSVAMPIVAAHSRRAGGARLIIVVDECDMAEEFAIWNRVRNDKEGADLVTIYNEPGLDRETTAQIRVEEMGGEQIAEILEEYMKNAGRGKDKEEEDVGAWVKYCGHSPRAAHIVGHSLAASPDGPLKDPGSAMVWERYVAGLEEIGGREYRDRLTVLLWLSQFTRFGFGAPYERDGERIAEIVNRHHPEIPAHRFREVVGTLRSMKVLQGGAVLYITPRILHEYMWLKWWERYGPGDAPRPAPRDGGEDGDTALGGGEASLLPALYSRYCDMLASMRESRAAAHAVESLFGRDGPLGGGAAPEDAIDSDLFEAASAVSPAAALGCAEAAADRMRRRGWKGASASQWLAAVAAGRRMLGTPETFARAARLLLALADGDGDAGGAPFGPDAGDAFRLAFDPAPEAGLADVPLAARLEVLADAVRRGAAAAAGGGGGGGADGAGAPDGGANGEHARRAALRACGAVLEMRQFSIAIPRQQGAGSSVRYWQPKDRAGLAAYLRGVLDLLAEAADDSGNSAAVRQEAADAVLASLAQASLLPEIAEESIKAAERMRSAGLIDGRALLAAAERLAADDTAGVDPAAMRRIRAIVDEGTGAGGLHERLAWRVGRDGCAYRSRFGAAWNDRAEIGRLAGELAGDAAALESELEWLFGKEAAGRAAAALGYEIAARDVEGALLGGIEGAARRAAGAEGGGSMHLLAGYLARMCRERPDTAEDAMDRMLERGGALCGALPMVAGMAGGVSDRSARRLARAAADGGIKRGDLGGAVRGRGALDEVSEEAFWMVAGALAAGGAEEDEEDGGGGGGDAAAFAALDIVHGRYAARGAGQLGRRMPAEAVAGILLHGRVLGGRPIAGVRDIYARRWTETALALVGQERDGGTAARMADAVIGRLGAPGIFEDDAAAAAPVLDKIARAHPRTVWRIAASLMGPPLDKRACIVRAWLAGRAGGRRRGPAGRTAGAAEAAASGGIGAVPASVVLEWAAEDPPARARRAAEVMSPPRLDAARDLVSRFGHLEGVADGAARALESWQAWAARAADKEGARARLESMRRDEEDPAVAEWLDRCIGILGAGISGLRGQPAPLLSR